MSDQNRRHALDHVNTDVTADPNDAFAWLNLGASLTYFERYSEAAQAFDRAFTLGLPQRMTRYQFWPFVAYFNADRIDYLLELTEKTYSAINGNYAEEALLWHGWGLFRQGDTQGAQSAPRVSGRHLRLAVCGRAVFKQGFLGLNISL